MARDGVWDHWIGMWFSSMILLPLGIFLTYKAMTDSVIMSTDTYTNFFRKLFFIREKRNYTIKEVVIEEPDYDAIYRSIGELTEEVTLHLQRYGRLGYKSYWTDNGYDLGLASIRNRMEHILNQLSNSRNPMVIEKAKEYPVLIKYVRPFHAGSTPAKLCMYLFPLGVIVKLISGPFERRINRDLNAILKLNNDYNEILNSLKQKMAI